MNNRWLSRAATTVAATTALAIAAMPGTAAAKTCHSGYTHAVIGGVQKCLHAGEYCARRYQQQYLKYGFTCDRWDGREYHLERRR